MRVVNLLIVAAAVAEHISNIIRPHHKFSCATQVILFNWNWAGIPMGWQAQIWSTVKCFVWVIADTNPTWYTDIIVRSMRNTDYRIQRIARFMVVSLWTKLLKNISIFFFCENSKLCQFWIFAGGFGRDFVKTVPAKWQQRWTEGGKKMVHFKRYELSVKAALYNDSL